MAMLAKLVLLASMAFPLFLEAQTTMSSMEAHAQAARAAEKRNDFPVAVREYRALAKMLPGNAEVESNLGVALYFDHELRPAVAVLRKAIAINPSLMAPHLFSGLALVQLSNPDAAVPELEKAVKMTPTDPLAHTWLGYAYSAQGRNVDAVKQFEAASRLQPENVDVWYALGHTWLEIGKAATLKLLAAAPDGGRVWELAGEQEVLRGDKKAALHDFKQAYARRPDLSELAERIRAMGGTVETVPAGHGTAADAKADALYAEAHDAEQQSHAAFERVAQLAPDSYRAHQIMAEAFVSEKQYGKAIAEYETVLKMKPDLPGIHDALGDALLQSGNPAGALEQFDAEIKIQPYSARAYVDAGRVLLMQGKDDATRKMLNAALTMNRPPILIHEMLGNLDVRAHQYSSAITELKRYTAQEKDNSTAYWLLAMAYRGLGDKQGMSEAIAMYKKTSTEEPKRSSAQKELQPTNPDTEGAGVKLPAQ